MSVLFHSIFSACKLLACRSRHPKREGRTHSHSEQTPLQAWSSDSPRSLHKNGRLPFHSVPAPKATSGKNLFIFTDKTELSRIFAKEEQLQIVTEKCWNKGNDWFDSNFRRYYQKLCFFALQYIKDADAAEDVVQGVFLRLLDNKENLKSEEHLKYFLYQSVRNACLNEMKAETLHSHILEKIPQKQEEEDFFWQIVRTEVYQKIEKAVSELPPECGRIFRMAYLEHLDNTEIAARLSLSVNTVKVQKAKAKHALREKLRDIYPLLVLLGL